MLAHPEEDVFILIYSLKDCAPEAVLGWLLYLKRCFCKFSGWVSFCPRQNLPQRWPWRLFQVWHFPALDTAEQKLRCPGGGTHWALHSEWKRNLHSYPLHWVEVANEFVYCCCSSCGFSSKSALIFWQNPIWEKDVKIHVYFFTKVGTLLLVLLVESEVVCNLHTSYHKPVY